MEKHLTFLKRSKGHGNSASMQRRIAQMHKIPSRRPRGR